MYAIGNLCAGGTFASRPVIGVHGMVPLLRCRSVTSAWLGVSRVDAERARIRAERAGVRRRADVAGDRWEMVSLMAGHSSGLRVGFGEDVDGVQHAARQVGVLAWRRAGSRVVVAGRGPIRCGRGAGPESRGAVLSGTEALPLLCR